MKHNRIFALLLALLLALTSFGLAEEMLDTEFTFEIEGEEAAAPQIVETEEEVDMTPKSVESDFEFSFADDGSRVLLQYNGKDANVVIPKDWNVSIIAGGSFYNNWYLKSITLPATVKTIEGSAFCYCCQLRTVKLSEGLTEIGGYAFARCGMLTGIKLPKSLRKLGGQAFYYSGLKSIAIPEGVTTLPYEIFGCCVDLTSVTLPKGLTLIENNAFESCVRLKSIKLPETLTRIESNAFDDCVSLTSIKLPNSVKELGAAIFYNCTSLKSVTLPKDLQKIPENMFTYCRALKSVVIPESVSFIGYAAFAACSGLTSVTLPGDPLAFSGNVFDCCDHDMKWNAFPGSAADEYAVDNGFTTAYRKDYALAAKEKTVERMIGETVSLDVFAATPAAPVGASFGLKSSSAKVLVVDNEALTAEAKAEGTATLTATMTVADPKNAAKALAKKTASVKVKVNDPSKLLSVEIVGGGTQEVAIGGTLQLIALPNPDVENVTYAWKSSKAAIAAVNESGEVSGVKKGTATITVTATQGKIKKTASVKVEVIEGNPIELSFLNAWDEPIDYFDFNDLDSPCLIRWTDSNGGAYHDQAKVIWYVEPSDFVILEGVNGSDVNLHFNNRTGRCTVTLAATINGKTYTKSISGFVDTAA